MNIEKLFRDSSNVFECDSVDEAIAMFKIAHDLGLKWAAGQSYANEDLIREYWRIDGKEQVFRVATGYRNISPGHLLPGDKVYKFSEIIKQNKMKGFTKQEFLDKKVAIEWEDSKAGKINAFLKECYKDNSRATGYSKYYYTKDTANPGYYNGVDTVTALRSEGIRRHYKIDELIKEEVPVTEATTQKISRENLAKVYKVVCTKWQGRIDTALTSQKFASEIEVDSALLKEAFKEADAAQKRVLLKHFKEPKPGFQAKDLKVGEVMKVTGNVGGGIIGKHIMRIYETLVVLEEPQHTWTDVDTNTIEGVKLAPGMSILVVTK